MGLIAIEPYSSSGIFRILQRDRRRLVLFVFVFSLIAAFADVNVCQNGVALPSPSPTPSPSPKTSTQVSLERHFFTNILKDQYGIWTAPFHFRRDDIKWLIPLGAASTAFFATDEQTARLVGNNANTIKISHDVSQLGSGYATGGAAVSIYLWGRATHNARARETGVLALEALIDTGIVTEVVKTAAQRARPLQAFGEGEFFTHGSSFFSGHSSSIWSLAAVIDGEYGKRHAVVRYGVFGLATAVSLSRFSGRNHFLSDILIGGAVGYGVGHFVYLRHHDAALDQPSGTTKPTTMLRKYFPRIEPEVNGRTRTYGAVLGWDF